MSATAAASYIDIRVALDGIDTLSVLPEVAYERASQDAKWGQQNHKDGTGSASDRQLSKAARSLTDYRAKNGTLAWRQILDEEVREAFAESDTDNLREELIQVAAVAVAWVEAIDRRNA